MSRVTPAVSSDKLLLRWGLLLARYGRGDRVARLLARRRLRLRRSPMRPTLEVVSTHTTPTMIQYAATPPPGGPRA